MSAPFKFSPQAEYFPPTPGVWGYRETVYPSSPYTGPPIVPEHSPDGSPNTPERPLFSGLNSEYPWTTPRPRQRRTSWHGPTEPPVVPFIPPTPTSAFSEPRFAWPAPPPPPAPPIPAWFPETPVIPPLAPAPPIPHIAPPIVPPFPSTSYVPPTPYTPYAAAPVVPPYAASFSAPAQLQIHPLLNGEAPNELSFDLALTSFSPHRVLGPDNIVPLTAADIAQPAFFPAVTRLHIVCDAVAKWPVDIQYGDGLQGPPVTLGDILVAVHKTMHQPISRQDWEALSTEQETLVSQAFTQRCRLDTHMQRVQGNADYQSVPARRLGIKVVDFLQGQTMFRGLVRDGEGTVKMVVSK